MKFKCKMCGAPLDVKEGQTVVTCSFCQSTQTVANADDERKENLYNRANALRVECDFDKAILAYQSILSIFPDEAEAHWGVCLCKYGIEYVDDPSNHKKKPTIHRMSYDSILKDSDYLAALTYADVVAKEEYVTEATEISNIQKNILSISQKEKPFDIFICYKETDANGKRTPDSVMAQEIYSNLTDRGYKVFFSRITLESKLGSMYEPYIFAALNSAKIMLVLGTKTEYFNATWVKNEWARFIDLMKTHPDHYLIPCYRDMDAYQMPEEFLSFQAQDLSKLGFMQDLLRGIDKIMGREQTQKAQAETKVIQTDVNVSALLKRTEILLGDGDFEKADELLEKVLDNDPTNSKAYLYKLLIERRLHSIEELKDSDTTYETNSNFKKAYDFGNDEEKAKLDAINEFINRRNREATLDDIYSTALALKKNGVFDKAQEKFESISEYRDSKEQALECVKLAKDQIYDSAVEFKQAKKFDEAVARFGQIKDYKDSESQIHECEELKKEDLYQNACSIRDKGGYDAAAKLFGGLSDYKDSAFQVEECARLKENARKEAIYVTCLFKDEKEMNRNRKALEKACTALKTIPGYKDSDQLLVKYAGIIKEWDIQLAKAAEEKKRARAKLRKKAKKISLISGGAAVLVTGTLLLTFLCFVPLNRQGKIEELIDSGDYQQAWDLIRENGNFGDTSNLTAMVQAGEAFDSLDYESGINFIYDIGGSVDVNYDGNGGQTESSQTIKKKHIDNISSKDGYDFKGWVLSDYTLNASDHHATINLLAQYTMISYSLKYNLNGGECSENLPSEYNTEESLTLPNPTKKGYTFIGWSENGTGTATVNYTIPSGSIGNKKFFAHWKANTYKLTINNNGGPAWDIMEVTYDSPYRLFEPGRQGYAFAGYTFYPSGEKCPSSGTWMWDSDMTIIANWKANTDTPFTVNYFFEGLDGTFVKETETKYGTTDMNCAINPKEVEGFTPDKSEYIVRVKADGTSSIDIYYRRNSYTLSFETNGGTAVESVTLKYGEAIPSDIVTVREGYTFAGWYADVGLSESLTKMPGKNQIAYAYYSEETRAGMFTYEETQHGVIITGHTQSLFDDIVVPPYINGKKVVSLKDGAFSGCNKMTSIVLPDSIHDIGARAFENCTDLTSVTGCTDLTEIKENTFSGCKNLAIIPDLTKVSKIGDGAFKDCASLTTIDTGSSLTSIGAHAFEGCSMLLTTPDIAKVSSIGDEAFKNCGLLSEIRNLDGNATIGNGIFSGCENIRKLIVSFKKNVEEFYVAKLFGTDSLSDNKKFYGVSIKDDQTYYIPSVLSDIDVDQTTELPGYLFYGLKSLEKIQFLSGSLTKIGKYTFSYCSSLTEAPDLGLITEIPDGAFLGCSGITDVTLADQMTSIGTEAFSGCSSLAEINSETEGVFNLPETISTIGDSAFSGCSLIQELHVPFVSGVGDEYPEDVSYSLGHIFGAASYRGQWRQPKEWVGAFSVCRFFLTTVSACSCRKQGMLKSWCRPMFFSKYIRTSRTNSEQ